MGDRSGFPKHRCRSQDVAPHLNNEDIEKPALAIAIKHQSFETTELLMQGADLNFRINRRNNIIPPLDS